MHLLLLLSVFVIATCGLIYELVAGTLASYLLGDSVTQFSITIGVYLFSMGIGAYFSRFFTKHLLSWFIQVEILVGLVGGISSSLLFLLFEQVASFRIILYTLICLTGTFVGLEIPLLMNILKNRYEFRDLVSKVFTFDYIGALLASIVFPLVLVPYMGLIRTSYFFGMLNVAVALIVCFKFEREIRWATYLKIKSIVVLLLLLAGFIYANRILSFSESLAYAEPVIYARSSPYQRIVLTKAKKDLRLYLNGNLQFSSMDEYRYHEALVHPVMMLCKQPSRVLVLGGGDGMAVREILKYPSVKEIKLVDLDAEVTRLFEHNNLLLELNKGSLLSSRVKVINADAFQWLKQNRELFDAVIIDFPDPSNYAVGKLYTNTFYRLLRNALHPASVVVVQSTSPYVAPRSFWCVNTTLQSAGFNTLPYHTYVPSFGEWGYVIGSLQPLADKKGQLAPGLRYFSRSAFEQMRYFSADMQNREVAVNKLNNQVLVQYFEDEWGVYQN